MTGQAESDGAAVRCDGRVTDGGEQVLVVALGVQERLQVGQHRLGPHPSQHEPPPGDPQRHSYGSLVGAVAGNVADHEAHRPVGQFDGVVEVAAEEKGPAGRAIAGGGPQTGLCQHRPGQEPSFQAGALGRHQLSG